MTRIAVVAWCVIAATDLVFLLVLPGSGELLEFLKSALIAYLLIMLYRARED